jgi:hypothetical protein
MAQCQSALLPDTVPVRTAGNHAGVHCTQGAEVNRPIVETDFAAKSTHRAFSGYGAG